MLSLAMHHLIHWFIKDGSIIAVLVTVGVAVLLVCCVECTDCPCKEKDDIFRRHAF